MVPQKRMSLNLIPLCFLTSMILSTSLARGQDARELLDAAGVKGGLIVHLGCGDGKLTAALRANDGYLVHGLDADARNVEKARKHIQSLGLYGKVSVDQWKGVRLPYVDNLVNLLVANGESGVEREEIMRVLAPGGVAVFTDRQSKIENRKFIKPRPKEIDEWAHYLHDPSNNAVARDTVVGPPRHIQWLGSPRWTRHHDNMASMSALVSSGGRIFYIFDEGSTATLMTPSKWSLIARDAFNGTILWKRPIDYWHTRFWPLKSGPAQLPRRLVASGERVYVTLGLDAPVTALDAATGKTVRTYEGTKGAEEILLDDGVLFLQIDEKTERPTYASIGDARRRVREPWWDREERLLMAVRAESGEVLWRKKLPVATLTLAVAGERVYLHDGEKIVCLNRQDGSDVWSSEPIPIQSPIRSLFAPTLVVYKDVVLFSGGSVKSHRDGGGNNTMVALSAETGKKLWTADHPPSGYKSPEDVFVADGLVWFGATMSGGLSGVVQGLDPRTGEVKKEFPPDVETYWFHHRCHRGKATERYLLTSRTGIEFIDIRKEHWITNHWVRGGCLYGIMPCNGLIYAPPHPCICYPESKQFGFNALAAESPTRQVPKEVPDEGRLEKGPAYSKEIRPPGGLAGDWPTYRGNAARSGFTKAAVPTDLKRAWQAEFGGRLSSPVIAEGRVFVASVDEHTVHALDASSGKRLWSYTAGGRVDSPPTLYQGLVLFGSADGWVYCLRTSDGVLVWRFRAAPVDQRLTAFEQVESVWPVHGSVLVLPDPPGGSATVRFVAGRSMFLDGGLRLLRLDAKTGTKLSETILDDRDPKTGENLQVNAKVLNMPVALPDVLSSDGRFVYMRSQRFDLDGKRLEYAPHSGQPTEQGATQHVWAPHLFCATGFLDGSWFHRSYFVYGCTFAGGWNGYYEAGKFAPGGRLLVFDEKNVYGYGRKPKYYRWTTPMEYHLFSASKAAPQVDPKERNPKGSCIRFKRSKSLDPTKKPLTVEAWVKAQKPSGVVVAKGASILGYTLFLERGKPRFAIRVDRELSSVSAKQRVVGKWTHLAGVLTADKQLQLYVNGKLAASTQVESLFTKDPAQPLEVGTDGASAVADYRPPFGLTGLIDEVRIYSRALTADEIAQHASAPEETPAKDEALALHLSFEKGDGTDDSGNGNNGETEKVTSVEGKVGKAMKFVGARGVAPFFVQHHWTQDVPMLVRAMVLADKTLFIAGPPDVLDEEEASRRLGDEDIQKQIAEQDEALMGKKGGLLWAVSAADGKKLAEWKLDSPPTWDGMAAADGRLYLTTTDGRLRCMAGTEKTR